MSFAHPEVLVETNWVEDHINDSTVRIIEVDYDPENAYNQGHIKNAGLVWWKREINDPVRRDIINTKQFEELMSKLGIIPDTTLVLYGDFNNWFAAFALWVFKYHQHQDVRIMNGGRKKWEAEQREYVNNEPKFQPAKYIAKSPNETIRAYLSDVRKIIDIKDPKWGLVDVRSPKEYAGEITAPSEYPTEHAQRGGHIPGAANIVWSQAVNDDGTFKSFEELNTLYQSKGIIPDKNIITYCRIGERSSHTWFVLKYLLGYQNVKNYDGSWTEWGNMIRNPIEK
ncbi:MAG: sulfurtransferase [Thaumarchaeota archaeon]|nr:sulfurtransferase [Nitrososphaerota archaeon]